MRIGFNTVSGYVAHFLSEKVFFPLTEQQKKVACIVAAVFALIAVGSVVLFYRCMTQAKPLQNGAKSPLNTSGGNQKGSHNVPTNVSGGNQKASHPLDGPGGKIVYPNGTTEEGEFYDGKLNGRGKRTWPNGKVEEGEFKDGKLHGPGSIHFPGGKYDEGDFEDGELHGQGKRLKSMALFEGEFERGKFKKGTYTDQFYKVIYEGEFSYTFLGGPGGKATHLINGTVETGNFEFSKLDGLGIRTFANGSREEGEFEEGQLKSGKEIDANGIVVQEGEFKDKKIVNGKGKITYPDGTIYEGEFKNGRLHGKGQVTYSDGKVKIGTFEGGKFQS